MTRAQILEIFHRYDKNGDMSLNKKELIKLLKHFKCELSEADAELLVRRFDKDGDGELDLDEFLGYVEEELQLLTADTLEGTSLSAVGNTNELGESRGRSVASAAAAVVTAAKDTSLRKRGSSVGASPRRSEAVVGSRTGETSKSATIASSYRKSSSSSLERTKDAFAGTESRSLTRESIEESLRRQLLIEKKLGKKYY